MTVFVRDCVLKALLCRDGWQILDSCNADVVIAPRRFDFEGHSKILLIDSARPPIITGSGSAKNLVSCGMSEKCSVNFSSIREYRAVLCVQRRIVMENFTLECGEFPVDYFPRLSLWQNLALCFCKTLRQQIEQER